MSHEGRTGVIAWTRIGARQQDLALLLGAERIVLYPKTATKVGRYIRSGWRTWRYVRGLRVGDICIVSAPPVFTPALTLLAGRPGVGVVMDSHPGAFGLMGDRFSRVLQPVHTWALKRAGLVLVTTERLASRVRTLGAESLVFHEPDRPIHEARIGKPSGTPTVLFPGSFSPDEPFSVVLATAGRLQELDFRVTGDAACAPRHTMPSNVHLTGWLDPQDFEREVHSAGVVLALTTESESVMRTAYEAIRARKPLVVTRTAATEKYFPYAWHVANTPKEIAAAITEIRSSSHGTITVRTAAAFHAERALTADQTRELVSRLAEISNHECRRHRQFCVRR